MKRRTPVLIILVAFVSLAGCTAISDFSDSPTDSTPTETSPIVVSGEGDYGHDIRVDNDLYHNVTLTIQVDNPVADSVGNNGSVLYRDSHTVPNQSEQVVAGFPDVELPEESRYVRLSATDSQGGSASVSVTIYDCLGSIIFHYSDGELDATYSIC